MTARLVIAGTHSGVGKTTLTVGLIAALKRRSLVIQPFKVGPDYIDPSYHTVAAGWPCRNLDTWMVPPDRVVDLFAHVSRDVDIALVEGVMGLYDGFGYQDESGSTAQVAKLLGAPVVLVLDASHMARSAGALALGYQQYDSELALVGFILNRVAGEQHGQGVAAAVQEATGLPVLGWLPRDSKLQIPERHLGLVPTTEPRPHPGQGTAHPIQGTRYPIQDTGWRSFIEVAADQVTRHIDLECLLAIAEEVQPLSVPDLSAVLHIRGPRVVGGDHAVIAVARDEAFSFTYEDNLDLLRATGAEIAFFSPLHDTVLPPNTAVVALSGGFPELYAAQLAANAEMYQAIRQAHQRGIPIYAECGGLMYLTETIIDLEEREHPMIGLLPGHSRMTTRLTLGYRLAQAADDSWLLAAGEVIRGHEFHYSVWEDRPDDLPPAYYLLPPDGQGEPYPEGAHIGNLWASYVHLHFWGKPELIETFSGLSKQIQQLK